MAQQVVVVIGVGGMGQAIARRMGPGAHLLIADFNKETVDTVAGQLAREGYTVTSMGVDVSTRESVAALAQHASSLGPVQSVVHTAGLSPTQASVSAILAVNLLGVAWTLDKFTEAIVPHGAGVVIASMSAHGHPGFSQEEARELATTPAYQLLSLPITAEDNFPDSGSAYSFAKRANLLRVQAMNTIWAAHGARVNSISPGVIATPMGQAELSGEHSANMRAMIDASNAKRVGTAADIAEAAAFLLSPSTSFISGTDLLVDGGVTAASVTAHSS